MRNCALFALLALSIGCSETHTLRVDVVSDLNGGTEFDVAVLEVDGLESRRVAWSESQDFVMGVRLATYEDISSGRYAGRISLRLGEDEVLTRDILITVEADVLATISMARSCLGVQCPEAGDSAGAIACLGGVCVEPGCVTGEETECASSTFSRCTDESCGESNECVQNTCEPRTGSCLRAERCPPGTRCDESGASCEPEVCECPDRASCLLGSCDSGSCEYRDSCAAGLSCDIAEDRCLPDIADELAIILQTDFKAGEDFHQVEVDIDDEFGLTLEWSPLWDLTSGEEVAVFGSISPGPVTGTIRLRRTSDDLVIVERPIATTLAGRTELRVTLTRSCEGRLDCPEACLGGECVPTTCSSGTEESCPAFDCSTCRASATCLPTVCTPDTGICLSPSNCVRGSYCDPVLDSCRDSDCRLASCAETGDIEFAIVSDFRPVEAFDEARLSVDGVASGLSFEVRPEQDFLNGQGLSANFGDLSTVIQSGEISIGFEGVGPVLSRNYQAAVNGPGQLATIALTRNCLDVTCPTDADRDATVCLGGRCVVPTCLDGRQRSCPPPQCTENADCSSPAPCFSARCYGGALCLFEDTCPPGETCSVDLGACE